MDILKTVHIVCAALSVSGFALRGYWMWRGSPLLTARATRILPHFIDTALLVSAIALAVRIHQYPLVHGWLTAKLVALLAYIVLGAVALRYGRSRRTRVLALVLALLTFLYIVTVAITRQAGAGLFQG